MKLPDIPQLMHSDFLNLNMRLGFTFTYFLLLFAFYSFLFFLTDIKHMRSVQKKQLKSNAHKVHGRGNCTYYTFHNYLL